MRKTLAALAALALTAAGCGGSDDSSDAAAPAEAADDADAVVADDATPSTTAPPPPSSTTEPVPDQDIEADTELAVESLLVLSDFPAEWIEEPVDDGATEQLAPCLSEGRTSIIDVGDAEARTGDFTDPVDDSTVSETVGIAATVAIAVSAMADFTADDVPACYQDVFADMLEGAVDDTTDPANTLPPDAELGQITVTRVDVDPVGDDSSAVRATVPITVGDIEVDLVVDLVLVRQGRALAGLTFQSEFAPFPADEVNTYAALAASRLPTNGGS